MLRIINSLASVTFDEYLDAVVLNFIKDGSEDLYIETLDLVFSLPPINRSKKWLLVKNNFEDVSLEQFIKILSRWEKATSRMDGQNPASDISFFLMIEGWAKSAKRGKFADKKNILRFSHFNNIKIFSSLKEAGSALEALKVRIANVG